MKKSLKEIQEIETDMLKEIYHICQRNDIPYFLSYGSALGAIRHGGPIPWDTDSDIIVPITHFETFCAAMRNELPEKYYLDYTNDQSEKKNMLIPRIGLKGYSTSILHVDVFKLVGVSSDPELQKQFAEKTKKLSKILKIKSNSLIDVYNNTSIRNCCYFLFMKCFYFWCNKNIIHKQLNDLCFLYPYEESVYVTNPNDDKAIEKFVYGNGTKVNYCDFLGTVPEHYDKYLKHFYDDYMLPRKYREAKQYYEIRKFRQIK